MLFCKKALPFVDQWVRVIQPHHIPIAHLWGPRAACCWHVPAIWPAGIMLFRKKALPFVEEWVRVIESDDKIWDQNAFNDLARKGQHILPDDPNHYFKGARGVAGAAAEA